MAIAFRSMSAPDAGSSGTVGPSTLLDRLIALLNGAGAGTRRSRAQDRPDRLDDRTLKDIGIHRSELSSILHHDLRDPSRRGR